MGGWHSIFGNDEEERGEEEEKEEWRLQVVRVLCLCVEYSFEITV